MKNNRHDKEKIIFSNYTRAVADTVFNVLAAGETYPDPYYYMERDNDQLRFNDYYCNTGMYVLEFVKSGKGYIESEGKRWEVNEGDFYFLCPFAPYSYYSDPNDPFCKMFINIGGPFVTSIVKGLRINDCVRIKHHDISGDMEYIHSMLSRTDLTLSDIFDAVATRVCAILLLLKPRTEKKQNYNRLAVGIRQYIDDNIGGALDLDTICRYFYVSKSNLISIFQKEFGSTPHKYIMEKRIDTAKKLLKNDNLTISEIAKRMGFEGEKYFYSAFKKVTSTTPGKYRELIEKDR